MTAFEEMGVLPELGKAVDDMGWMLPTDVQAEAIPLILGGGDVLMAAETGSGKTGAFCLPVLQIVWETLKDIQSGKGGKHIASKAAKFSKCALNLFDRGEGMAITPDGLLCQSRDPKQWFGSRGTMGVTSKGKYYYEATVTDDGLCRVGWATLKGSLDVGTDDQSFGFGGTGKKSFCKNFDPYGESFGLKDTIGCYLDLDNNIVHFSKNDKIFPKAYDIPSNLRNAVFFPAVVLKNAEISFNFGDESLKYPPPSEFMPISQAPSSYIVLSDKKGAGPAVSSKCNKLNAPYCLIIEPSGVLASQTSNELEKFSKYLDNPTVRNLLIVGGEPAKDQMRVLEAGVDIVTGTPGRLQEFISTGQLSLQKIRFFILDEADGLLSQGHGDLINKIYASVPKVSPDGKRLQMVVCSATLHNFDGCIENVQEKMMHFPQWVDLKGQDSVPETVHHVVVIVNPMADKKWINAKKCILTDGVHALDDIRPGSNTSETLSEAVKRLKGDYVLQAIREHKMDQALIFCRTKIDCDNMEKWLRTCGGPELSCVCLHGDRRPDERKKNLNLFKEGKVKFLICTDVAARGIDVKGMPYVINVTLPDEKQNYVHRIGRVGRADRMGLAISLVSSVPEKVWYHSCPSRGKSCRNTRLTDDGGCCIWYKEPTLLAEIEDHLGVTIQQTDPEMKIKTNEFDGKVTYGAKRSNTGSGYKGHADLLAASVKELAEMEKASQTSYLKLRYAKV